jgi:hypothetical protein
MICGLLIGAAFGLLICLSGGCQETAQQADYARLARDAEWWRQQRMRERAAQKLAIDEYYRAAAEKAGLLL